MYSYSISIVNDKVCSRRNLLSWSRHGRPQMSRELQFRWRLEGLCRLGLSLSEPTAEITLCQASMRGGFIPRSLGRPLGPRLSSCRLEQWLPSDDHSRENLPSRGWRYDAMLCLWESDGLATQPMQSAETGAFLLFVFSFWAPPIRLFLTPRRNTTEV